MYTSRSSSFASLLSLFNLKLSRTSTRESPLMKLGRLNLIVALGLLAQPTLGVTPIAADGWSFKVVASGLNSPRGILFDGNGGLLVVQQGAGIIHLALNDSGGVNVGVSKTTNIVNSTAVRSEPCSTLLKLAANCECS